MNVIILVLLLLAGVCFGLAAANTASKVNLIAVGLLAWVITFIIKAVEALH